MGGGGGGKRKKMKFLEMKGNDSERIPGFAKFLGVGGVNKVNLLKKIRKSIPQHTVYGTKSVIFEKAIRKLKGGLTNLSSQLRIGSKMKLRSKYTEMQGKY